MPGRVGVVVGESTLHDVRLGHNPPVTHPWRLTAKNSAAGCKAESLDVVRKTAGYFRQPNRQTVHSASQTGSLRFIVSVSQGPDSLPSCRRKRHAPNDVYPDDDSFEQALREYREQTWDPAYMRKTINGAIGLLVLPGVAGTFDEYRTRAGCRSQQGKQG